MDFAEIISQSLGRYSDKRLEAVASKLFRPRIGQPRGELIERIGETHNNPPVVDRLLKNLPVAPRSLMALLGRSRQPRWRIDDLLTLVSSLGCTDGFPILETLFDRGVAITNGQSKSVSDFSEWFQAQGGSALVLVPPTILARAASLPLRLPEPNAHKSMEAPPGAVVTGDGLDWVLRLAAARQQVRIAPVKLTHSGSHYKRDQVRFSTDPVLQSPLEHSPAPVDAGTLALTWAMCAGLTTGDDELSAIEPPPKWDVNLSDVLMDLYAALFAVRDWDPLIGCNAGEGPSSTITAGILLAALLAESPKDFHAAEDLARWLWEHHPHWSGQLNKGEAANGGAAWVEAYLSSTLVPLRIAESASCDSGMAYRLSDFGRYLLADGPAPSANDVQARSLLVQPNGEILAYRRGLSPGLVAQLSRFAEWKQIGGACTLELTEAGVTRGLEDGLSLEVILQTLNRHGLKPVPDNVADLLRRWADKRERITVYRSATLVEFPTESDLESAMARGIVTVRLTNRIGLTAEGTAPEFKHLRLVGNRDYEAAPAMCVLAEDDGVTLQVNTAAADLLLDAEIARFAEPLPNHNGDARRYRMTPASLRQAAAQGQSLSDLDAWFLARSGTGLPAAAKLFFAPSNSTILTSKHFFVLETPTSEIADGLMQWPNTAPFTVKRLGPKALAIDIRQLPALQTQLAALGLQILGDGSENL